MLFQIHDFIEARLASVTPRSEVHGEDEKPAVSLVLSITTSGAILVALVATGTKVEAVNTEDEPANTN